MRWLETGLKKASHAGGWLTFVLAAANLALCILIVGSLAVIVAHIG